MDREAKVLPNALGSTLAYPMFRDGIGPVAFWKFLRIFPRFRKMKRLLGKLLRVVLMLLLFC
jgi:hypothetical protein